MPTSAQAFASTTGSCSNAPHPEAPRTKYSMSSFFAFRKVDRISNFIRAWYYLLFVSNLSLFSIFCKALYSSLPPLFRRSTKAWDIHLHLQFFFLICVCYRSASNCYLLLPCIVPTFYFSKGASPLLTPHQGASPLGPYSRLCTILSVDFLTPSRHQLGSCGSKIARRLSSSPTASSICLDGPRNSCSKLYKVELLHFSPDVVNICGKPRSSKVF